MIADTLEGELEAMRARVAKLKAEAQDARAALEQAVYFEARNALVHRPDVRVYCRDDPAHAWVIHVVAEWVEHRGNTPEAWVAVWPVSTGQAADGHLVTDGAEALARFVDGGLRSGVAGADLGRIDVRRIA
jgi:hypothetical protein